MLAICAAFAFQLFWPELVQPTTYRSPEGAWSLDVDPSSKHGAGPAHLRVEHAGELVWERELAVTPWGAAIDDAGNVAGYGYTLGPRSSEGELRLFVLSPEGERLGGESRERGGSAGPEGLPNPRVADACFRPALDLYAARVVDEREHAATWSAFRLSTGERIDEFVPPSDWEPDPGAHELTRIPRRGHARSVAELELPLVSRTLFPTDAPPPRGPVHDVLAFDVDAQGWPRIVRSEGEDAAPSLVQLDGAGAVLRVVRVDSIEPGPGTERAWWPLAGGDWLGAARAIFRKGKAGVWRVDGASGVVEVLEISDARCVEPLADGGFVALHTAARRLVAYDPSGAERWSRAVSHEPQEPEELPWPMDVALAPDGELALLTRDEICFVGARGETLLTLQLASSPLFDEGYPEELAIESTGALLVFDGDGGRWHRLTPDGAELASFELLRDDGGRSVGEPSSLRRCADGKLWTTDGRELLEVDAQGVAHSRFGAAPDARGLAEPSAVFVTGGRVAIVDGKTLAVHVFEPSGERAFVCVPAPGDFAPCDAIDLVRTSPDGRVYAHALDADRWLAFDAGGARVGWCDFRGELLAFDADGARWSGPGSVWIDGFVQRVGADGVRGARVERGIDHRFLEQIEGIACLPDGSLALLERADRAPCELHVFDRDGAPARRIELGGCPMLVRDVGANARLLLAANEDGGAFLFSLADGRASSWQARSAAERYGIGFSPDGDELWCATTEPLALERYALPR